ncbi:hypothetical protein [Vibrio sp. SCSIO 43136]|uniref:hypothetical protein n=1 Tax=Vibrio sp. SCSIO 43136 TaxID=2819101 RepID=UPI0020755A30|nr:hypothetical protein [Vibrio sp. SCSIO 43136]USD67146.1 hypothetical protein J4N39_21150 [Vibrio sp. SCSIO 43136]
MDKNKRSAAEASHSTSSQAHKPNPVSAWISDFYWHIESSNQALHSQVLERIKWSNFIE